MFWRVFVIWVGMLDIFLGGVMVKFWFDYTPHVSTAASTPEITSVTLYFVAVVILNVVVCMSYVIQDFKVYKLQQQILHQSDPLKEP